jgi:hypothetical protein
MCDFFSDMALIGAPIAEGGRYPLEQLGSGPGLNPVSEQSAHQHIRALPARCPRVASDRSESSSIAPLRRSESA